MLQASSYQLNCFSGRGDDTVPNLTDSLFVKIFEKNKFSRIEVGDGEDAKNSKFALILRQLKSGAKR